MGAPGPTPFSDIDGVTEQTLQVLDRLGFQRATPVQEVTIPLFLKNKDVAVDASTGSGKTLAFVVPIVEMLRRLERPLKRSQVGAIVISPTRELSRQIFEVAQPFVASLPNCGCSLLVGGTDVSTDVEMVRKAGAQVLVGTPGRIRDILDRMGPALDLKPLEVLILDEADRLLDMGFRKHLDDIMQRLPRQRRTGLFSATQTEAVEALSRAGLRNPVRVNVAVSSKSGGGADTRTPATLTSGFLQCREDDKVAVLVAFLRRWGASRKCIVYVLSCASVEFFSIALSELAHHTGGAPVWSLHGKMKQRQREAALEDFRKAPSGCLLCTDVAARGLDVPDVHWVLQMDPPQDPNAFVHRVGRTARLGRDGSALALLLPAEAEQYPHFLALRKVPLPEASLAAVVDMEALRELSALVANESRAKGGAEVKGTAQEGSERAGMKGRAVAGETSGGGSGGGDGELLELAGRAMRAELRRLAEKDRAILERGVRAFVSYIRGYKEHHCKFIFRLSDVDLGRLAYCFGLLRLPRMPEIKRKGRTLAFEPSSVDPETVPFRDKAREKQRRQGEAAREVKREKERQERQAKAAQHAQQAALQKLPSAKRKKLATRQDQHDMEEDYHMLRRIKKGKMSEEDFDKAIGLKMDATAQEGGPEGAKQGKQEQNLVAKAMKKKLKRKRRKAASTGAD